MDIYLNNDVLRQSAGSDIYWEPSEAVARAIDPITRGAPAVNVECARNTRPVRLPPDADIQRLKTNNVLVEFSKLRVVEAEVDALLAGDENSQLDVHKKITVRNRLADVPPFITDRDLTSIGDTTGFTQLHVGVLRAAEVELHNSTVNVVKGGLVEYVRGKGLVVGPPVDSREELVIGSVDPDIRLEGKVRLLRLRSISQQELDQHHTGIVSKALANTSKRKKWPQKPQNKLPIASFGSRFRAKFPRTAEKLEKAKRLLRRG
jgi:hypothetical protein